MTTHTKHETVTAHQSCPRCGIARKAAETFVRTRAGSDDGDVTVTITSSATTHSATLRASAPVPPLSKVVRALLADPTSPRTVKQIKDATALDYDDVRAALEVLLERGKIETVRTPGRPTPRYALARPSFTLQA